MTDMYLGANVEFTSEALSFTVHAEQSAITNAWLRGEQGGLMTPQANGLTLQTSDPVVQAALKAANACYAPYTKNFAGVALLGTNGTIYPGQYGENAAYNPSLSPLEAAITLMNMSLPPGTALGISRAVLVESPTQASQHDATTAVLSSFAPAVSLEYFTATA